MRKKNNIILTIGVFIVTCGWLVRPGYSAFDISGWGARPTGMGGAFCAVSDDANAIFWNPAGIARMKYAEATFMHCLPYLGLDLKRWDAEANKYVAANLAMNYLAAAYPLGRAGSVGLGWTNFNETILYHENAVSLNYALQVIGYGADEKRRRFSEEKQVDVYAGLNLKYVNHMYGMNERTEKDPVFGNKGSSTSVSGITAEIGGIAVIDKNISIGLAIKNIIPVNLGLLDEELLLPEIRLGGAYEVYENITPTLDILYRLGVPEAQSFNICLGCEAWFLYKTIGVRTGVNLDEIGIGFSFRKLLEVIGVQADYSFNYPFMVGPNHIGTHRVSITLQFGESLGLVAVEEQKGLDRKDKKAVIEQYYKQGVRYYKKGNYRAAIREWRKVLTLKPNHRKTKVLINKAREKME